MKLIICDDEEKVCQLIYRMLDWESLHFTEVHLVHSGSDAIRLAEQLRPDLIITDMRMPGYSGDQLIDLIKAFSPRTQFIVISGYTFDAHFPGSINSNVIDYLMKPVSREELRAAVTKALLKSSSVSPPSQTTGQALSVRFVDAQSMAAHLLAQQGGAPEARAEHRIFLFLIFQLFGAHGEQARLGQSIILQRLELLLPKIAEPAGISSSQNSSQVTVLLHIPKQALSTVRRKLRELYHDLNYNILMFPRVVLAASTSLPVSGTAELPDAYDAALHLSYQRLIEEDAGFFEPTPEMRVLLSRTADWSAFLRLLEEGLSSLQPDKTSLAFSRLGDALMSAGTRLDAFDCYTQLCRLGEHIWCRLYLGVPSAVPSAAFSNRYRTGLNKCISLKEILRYASRFTAEAIASAKGAPESDKERKLAAVIQYVEQHFACALTTELVRAQTGVEQVEELLLAHLHLDFSEYLAQIRLEHAKTLLYEQNISVNDVYRIVGYGDKRLFKRDFISKTGLSPKAFHKLYKREST